MGEAVVSVEGKVVSITEFPSRAREGEVGATMVVVEGTRFWVREDAVDEEGGRVDPAVLGAVGRMGGISWYVKCMIQLTPFPFARGPGESSGSSSGSRGKTKPAVRHLREPFANVYL